MCSIVTINNVRLGKNNKMNRILLHTIHWLFHVAIARNIIRKWKKNNWLTVNFIDYSRIKSLLARNVPNYSFFLKFLIRFNACEKTVFSTWVLTRVSSILHNFNSLCNFGAKNSKQLAIEWSNIRMKEWVQTRSSF